ncbi:hypothetical protein J5N97_026566 [Dioscorea zingiberensis]|uniref:Uncharacterized protein n=1 Tax=Dioscorea zingiberensis TaxID=325984 RepID=A0A9D5C3F3_9LILI|nr:hypothetical protein J5N97_026566 [Dioscorea zingiberensis]
MVFARRLCCCVWVPWPSSRSHPPPSSTEWWESIGVSESGRTTVPNRWWAKPFLKVREWSELVAGPRWKTFIRRFRRSSKLGRMASSFQYDPLSYALNFDDGAGHHDDDGQEEDAGFRDFSSRFAAAAAAAAAAAQPNEPAQGQTRGGI